MTDWFEIASPQEKIATHGASSHVELEQSGLRVELLQSELQRVLLKMQPDFRCDRGRVELL